MTLRALCPRLPVSMRPTQRCSSTVSRTLPAVNNTSSGLQLWQLLEEATLAQRSLWSLLGKVGPPGMPVVEKKGKEICAKVIRESALKHGYELAAWSPLHRSLSSVSLPLALCTISAIDWQPWYWLSSGCVARNVVVNYVVMNRAYPVKWPLGREIAGKINRGEDLWRNDRLETKSFDRGLH